MSRIGESRYMFSHTSETVDIIDRKELDRELKPILVEVMKLESGNDQHPAVNQLFNWLVDHQRTGEEFNYVIGELAQAVAYEVDDEGLYHMYLCTTAARALAMKCPVLEGAWEQAAWTLLVVTRSWHNGTIACDHLSAWIIYVISDPDICPNPYLRYEFTLLLTTVVELNDFLRKQAFKPILSACSYIGIDYHYSIDNTSQWIRPDLDELNSMDTCTLLSIFANSPCDKRDIRQFDWKLARKLLETKTMRCDAMIYDVEFICSYFTSSYSDPRELYGLMALFKSTDAWACRIIRDINKKTSNNTTIVVQLKNVIDELAELIRYFEASCQTPQLMELTSSCFMNIMKGLIKVKEELIYGFETSMYSHCIGNIYKLLKQMPKLRTPQLIKTYKKILHIPIP